MEINNATRAPIKFIYNQRQTGVEVTIQGDVKAQVAKLPTPATIQFKSTDHPTAKEVRETFPTDSEGQLEETGASVKIRSVIYDHRTQALPEIGIDIGSNIDIKSKPTLRRS